MDLVVGENITPQDIMDNYDVEEQQPPMKKKKKNPKTPISNFGTSLLKILENRQNVPEDPEKYFLMSLLPQIKSLTEDQKTQLYVEFLNAIQRVKYSSPVPPIYPNFAHNPNISQPPSSVNPTQNQNYYGLPLASPSSTQNISTPSTLNFQHYKNNYSPSAFPPTVNPTQNKKTYPYPLTSPAFSHNTPTTSNSQTSPSYESNM